MALIDSEQQYYYFKMRLGRPYEIKATTVHINTVINLIYQEMTTEQKEFYLENPTASVIEVWNCELTPPYVPPAQDVAEYANEKVKELKEACYASITVTKLECDMALDKTQNITADSYYSITEARNVLSDFRSQSKHAMQTFDTYSKQILAASTIKDVDALYNQAIEAL